MNFITCPECRNECHRGEYRKRGGGLHALCKTCRHKIACVKYRSRKKLTEIKHLSDEDQKSIYKVYTQKALISEYKKVTRLNRNRIKALEANNKPTQATKMWLNKRRAVQQLWIDGLNDLITQLHQDKKVPTLREYMENGIQNANHHVGFRDIL